MLTFSRSKLVGVERPKEDVFLAHGVLDDYIYAMELDVKVKLPDFEIINIKGRFKRFTTPECEKAVPVLQNAIGLHILDEDFAREVNRVVGKAGCTHFANLLLECCDGIRQAAIYGDWQELKGKETALEKEEYLKGKLKSISGLQNSCMVYSRKRG